MKKVIVISAVLALSACACFENNEPAEEAVVYQNVQARPQNCDYFDGTTCYRYVRRVRQAPVIRYREPRVAVATVQPTCAEAACGYVASQASCGGCAPQIRETREPVEVVYKKTTYKTVYEPKTSATVSYERAPYCTQPNCVSESVEVINSPAEEEIILNVK